MKRISINKWLFPLLFFSLLACSNDKEDCDTGFSGDDCDIQVIPRNIKVSKLTVLAFPNFNGGASWDSNSAPDIYPLVSLPGSTFIFNSSKIDSNVTSPGEYVFDGTYDLSPGTIYRFELKDFDENASDPTMSFIESSIYNSTNGFPSKVLLEDNALKIQLDVTYEF